jgi:hypothetical protein
MQCDFSTGLDLASSIAVLPSDHGAGRRVQGAAASVNEQDPGSERRCPYRRPAVDFATNDEGRPRFDKERHNPHKEEDERPCEHGEHLQSEDGGPPFETHAYGEPISRRPPPSTKGFHLLPPQDGHLDSDSSRHPPSRPDEPHIRPHAFDFDGAYHAPHPGYNAPQRSDFDDPRHPHAPPPPSGARPHHSEHDASRPPKNARLGQAEDQYRPVGQDDERHHHEHHDGPHAMDKRPAPPKGEHPRLPKGYHPHPLPPKGDHPEPPKSDHPLPPPKGGHPPPPPKGPKLPLQDGSEPHPSPAEEDNAPADMPRSGDSPVPSPLEDDKPPHRGPGGPGRGPGGPGREPTEPPPGWKGSLPAAGFEQAAIAGKWHDWAPGETRVRVDWTGFVSFYDPALTSLVEARRGVPRSEHRLLNISIADVDMKMNELELVVTRGQLAQPSNVDWSSVVRVIVERYSSRLERLAHTLENDSKLAAVSARNQILVMLAPYLSRESVRPEDGSKQYLAPVVHRCAATATRLIPVDLLTQQERLIHTSVMDTLYEVCRRLARMWDVAFDLEEAEADTVNASLVFMRTEASELMAWLDWSVWVRCRPACGEDVSTICYLVFKITDSSAGTLPHPNVAVRR